MAKTYAPNGKEKFTFGLWTVGNVGRDPFGAPTRDALSPVELIHLLSEVGAYGVNFKEVSGVLDEINYLTGGRGPDSCIDAVGLEAHDALVNIQAQRAGTQIILAVTR